MIQDSLGFFNHLDDCSCDSIFLPQFWGLGRGILFSLYHAFFFFFFFLPFWIEVIDLSGAAGKKRPGQGPRPYSILLLIVPEVTVCRRAINHRHARPW